MKCFGFFPQCQWLQKCQRGPLGNYEAIFQKMCTGGFLRAGSCSVEGAPLLMNFLQSDIREELKIINELSVRIPRRLEWRCQNREKSNILGHFLGIFRGGKRTPDGKLEDSIYSTFHVVSSTNKLFFNAFFLEMLRLGDSQLG